MHYIHVHAQMYRSTYLCHKPKSVQTPRFEEKPCMSCNYKRIVRAVRNWNWSAPSQTPSDSRGGYKLIWSFAKPFMARRSLNFKSVGTSASWPSRLAGTSVSSVAIPTLVKEQVLNAPLGKLAVLPSSWLQDLHGFTYQIYDNISWYGNLQNADTYIIEWCIHEVKRTQEKPSTF